MVNNYTLVAVIALALAAVVIAGGWFSVREDEKLSRGQPAPHALDQSQ